MLIQSLVEDLFSWLVISLHKVDANERYASTLSSSIIKIKHQLCYTGSDKINFISLIVCLLYTSKNKSKK